VGFQGFFDLVGWGWRRYPKMWWPATPCSHDGVASHPSFFIYLFLIFCFLFIFKNKIIKYYYFFNASRGRLMALGSLRRDPSHQLDALQSILDWRGSLSKKDLACMSLSVIWFFWTRFRICFYIYTAFTF
jgi:hypothetical protein